MIKIFVLNSIVAIIHFASVETTNGWCDVMINQENSFGFVPFSALSSIPEILVNVTIDSSASNNVKSYGVSSGNYKTGPGYFEIVSLRLEANNFGNRFKYFESGISPPEQVE